MTDSPLPVELLEREKITASAIHHGTRHRVVILRGSEGCGKTSLLEHIADKIDEQSKAIPAIFLYHCTPYKAFLLDIIYQMHKRAILPESDQTREWDDIYKYYNRGHSRIALTLIYQVFDAHPELTLCVDNIDKATVHGISLFRHIMQQVNPPKFFCTANSLERLHYLVWQAEILPIEPLSRKSVNQIIDKYIIANGMRVDSPATFKTQIFTISGGNPLAVYTKLKYCRYEPRVKKHLLSGQSLSAGRKEIDMSFIVVIIFVLAMMSRYIARSIGDTHLYMLGSIVAALTIGGRYFIFKGSRKEVA